jgi:hypothetical protein
MCDICHGFKHNDLRKPSLDADFNLYREYDSFAAEVDPRKKSRSLQYCFCRRQ